jgi:hypothetical protein
MALERAGIGRILNYDHYLLIVSLVQVALLNFYTAQTRVVRAMATTALASFASRFSADSKVAFTPEGLPVLDSADGEELSASYAGVELVLGGGAGPSLGPGALHVTTKCVRALLACFSCDVPPPWRRAHATAYTHPAAHDQHCRRRPFPHTSPGASCGRRRRRRRHRRRSASRTAKS